MTTSAPNEAARNRGLALFTAVSSAGASIGLLLGGVLTDFVSWHWTLFVNVPIGAVVLVLARRYVTETPRIRGRFDVVGAVTATLGSVAVVHGFISAADRGWTAPLTLASFVVGLALLALFVRTESRVAVPLLPLALVRNRTRGGALVLMALVVGAQFSTFFFVTQYLQLVLGFSPVATGAAFLPLSLAIFATSRVSARLVAKVGPRPMLLVGTLGLTASFVWLSTLSTTSTYAAHLLGALVLNGVSAALVFMPVTVVVLGGVDRAQAGTVSGCSRRRSSSVAPSASRPSSASTRPKRSPASSCRASSRPSSRRRASPSWHCSSRPSCCARALRRTSRSSPSRARGAVAVAARRPGEPDAGQNGLMNSTWTGVRWGDHPTGRRSIAHPTGRRGSPTLTSETADPRGPGGRRGSATRHTSSVGQCPCGIAQRAVETPCSLARSSASPMIFSAASRLPQSEPSTCLPGSRSL